MKEINWIEIKDGDLSDKEYFEDLANEFPSIAKELNLWDEDDIFNRLEE